MNQIPSFTETVQYAYQNIIVKLVQYIPTLVTALVIIILGWLIAVLIARLVNKLLRIVGVDKIFEQSQINDFLKNAGSRRDTVGLIAYIIKWILLLVVFMAAVQTLQLPTVSNFFNNILSYTPNILAAILILLLGAIFANVSDKVIEGALKASKISYGPILGSIAKYSILVFTIIASLSQLGIAKELLQIFFSGLIAMLALAGGLAFGLGGQETAKELLNKIKKETKE